MEFADGATPLDHAALVDELEQLLGIRVDVVSAGGLRGAIGERIRREAVPLMTQSAG